MQRDRHPLREEWPSKRSVIDGKAEKKSVLLVYEGKRCDFKSNKNTTAGVLNLILSAALWHYLINGFSK